MGKIRNTNNMINITVYLATQKAKREKEADILANHAQREKHCYDQGFDDGFNSQMTDPDVDLLNMGVMPEQLADFKPQTQPWEH
jgi:hypothetical protein